MSHTSTRRIGAAGVASGALVASSLLFAPSAQAAIADVRESQIAPTESTYAGWHQGAEGGKYQVVNEGLQLSGRSQVIKGYDDNKIGDIGNGVKNFDITKLPGSAFTVKSGSASFQVPLFVDPDGSGPAAAVFTTLRTPLGANGEVKAADDWEVSKPFGTIVANKPTPLTTIIDAIKDNPYKVIGFGVYSETGTSVISDITFNGDTYQFKNNAPVVADKTISTKINKAVTFPLTATDVDGNALTYTVTSVVGGAVAPGTGTTQTFTPTKSFKGNASVKYTVDDGRGGTSMATVTIKVEKSKGKVEIYRVHPTKLSVRSTVYVYASIFTDGQKAKQGTTVRVYAKGKQVGTSKVNSSGKVKVKLPNKLPAGNATLKVTQVGSSTLIGDSDSLKVKVRK